MLERLAAGATGPEIAAALGVSVDTVRSHQRRAVRKVDARTREQAVATAVAMGLIHAPP